MGFDLSSIFEGGVSGIFKGVSDLIKDFKPTPDKVLELQAAMQTAIIEADSKFVMAQTAINQAEAASGDKFTSRARPFILWVCGAAFAYTFLLQPFIVLGLTAGHVSFDVHQLPVLDWSMFMTVMGGILGLGGMRSYEKVMGVSK